MPNISRFVNYLLPAIASVTIVACGSSGGDSAEPIENRPTIVSSDGATVRENPEPAVADGEASAPSSTDSGGNSESGNNEGESATTADTAPANTAPQSERIDTIEALLAHLEARRTEESNASSIDTRSVESTTSSDINPDTSSEPLSDDPSIESSDSASVPLETNVSDELSPGTVATDDTLEDTSNTDPDTQVIASNDQPPVTEESSAVAEGTVQSEGATEGDAATDPADADLTDGLGVEGVTENGSEGNTGQTEDSESAAGATTEELQADDTLADTDSVATIDDGSFSTEKHDIVVDCTHALPCATSNDDGAVNVVVENVYRHPETRRLAIAMSVTANRDTAIKWDSDVTSTDDVATTYNGISREFSGFYQFDKDNDMVTLLAGTTLLVVQHFREMPSDTTVSLVRFDTGYIEAGVRTTLQFSNMPLDPVLGDIVDCADVVPCSWVSNDKSFSVNVLKVSGLWQTGRLRIDLEVRATVGMGINLFSADPVVGNDGSVFTPRTHSLGGTSDYQDFTVQLVPEGVLSGHQDFLKNANRLATSLKQVKLGISRVDAPGAGSPVFRNLPLE